MKLPFFLSGVVERGKQIGSSIGFPTANIAMSSVALPMPQNGVYAGLARIGQQAEIHLCILNQGSHPTAPEGHATVEAHLLNFPFAPLYGQTITLCYGWFIRPEQRFANLDELKQRLCQDKLAAENWLKQNPHMLQVFEHGKEHPL